MKNQLSRFFDSVWYPAVYAAVCVISGVNGKAVYVPMACLLATLIILSCFFAKNRRSFIAPVLMSFYCIGVDKRDGFNLSYEQLLGYYDVDGFLAICAVGVIAAAFLFVRLFRMGVFSRQGGSWGAFLPGILAIDGAFLLNGMFSARYQPVNLLYGLIFGAVLTFFYFLFKGCLSTDPEDRRYVCKIIVFMSLAAMMQLLIMCQIHWQEDLLNGWQGPWYPDRGVASLGWGIATSVGGVLVLGVPAAMYLAVTARKGWIWYGIALLITAASLIPQSRSSMVAAVLFLAAGAILGCVWGENRKLMRRMTAVLVILGICVPALLVVVKRLDISRLVDFSRLNQIGKDGRWALWRAAWEDFLQNPLFGIGFEEGARLPENRLGNVFSNMYHGIIPQFCGAMGILGICAIAKHLFDLGKATFRRFSAEKLLLAAVPGMILAMSMVDNFFFYANYQFVYCLFLALIEKTDEKRLAQ